MTHGHHVAQGAKRQFFCRTRRCLLKGCEQPFYPCHPSSKYGGQCTYVGSDGHRCNARHMFEVDHIVPVGVGGKGDISNIRLLCKTHNLAEARRVYGRKFMERFC